MISFEPSGDHTLKITAVNGESIKDLGLQEQGELREYTGTTGKLMRLLGFATKIQGTDGVHYVRKNDLAAYAKTLKFEIGKFISKPEVDFIGGLVALARDTSQGADFLLRKAIRIQDELSKHHLEVDTLKLEIGLSNDNPSISKFLRAYAAFEHLSGLQLDQLQDNEDLRTHLRRAMNTYLKVFGETVSFLREYAALLDEVRGGISQLKDIGQQQVYVLEDLRDYGIDEPAFKPTVERIERRFRDMCSTSIIFANIELTGGESFGELKVLQEKIEEAKNLMNNAIRLEKPGDSLLQEAEEPAEVLFDLYLKNQPR